MSVYIKSMEIPKRCDDCPFLEQTDYYASPYCRVSDDDDMMSINEIRAKRRDNCPLIPAADVRPVVRGKWIAIDFHSVKCSSCDFSMDIMKVDTHVLNHVNFCPNCGADMREGC